MQSLVNATHPGGVQTDQQKQAIDAYGTLGKIGVAIVKPLLSDPVSSGCRSALFAATSDEIVSENITGQYIVPDKQVTSPNGTAQDAELGEKLWALQEELLKERFGQLPY
jgi:WW domain-containing oxidoreductase